MKTKLRGFVQMCLIACFAFVMTAYADGTGAQTTDQTKIDTAKTVAENMFNQFVNLPDDQIDELILNSEDDQDTVLAAGLNSWKTSKEDLGAFVSIDNVTTTVDSKGRYTTTVEATFEKRQCKFVMGMDRRLQNYTELTFTPHYTVAENMESAAGNLVVGMGTVFIILIFIAWIISLFKYINKMANKEAKKTAPAPKAAPVVKVDPAVDDQTLLVIMSAISAYENGETTFTPYIETSDVPVCDNGIRIKSVRKK